MRGRKSGIRQEEIHMAKANDNYLRLPGNYLFSTIGQKVREYQEAHPEADVIRLGIGDVTQPLAPSHS